MTLKDIAKQLSTAVQTVPNLVQILRDGLEQAETGEEVVVTQTLESGTEIGSIKVGDDEAVKLYAPDSNIIYSTSAEKIGKWTDGKDLYMKVIPFTFVSGQYTHVIIDTDTVDSVVTIDIVNAGGSCIYVSASDYLRAYRLTYSSNDGIMIERGASTTTTTGNIIVKYTKAE